MMNRTLNHSLFTFMLSYTERLEGCNPSSARHYEALEKKLAFLPSRSTKVLRGALDMH